MRYAGGHRHPEKGRHMIATAFRIDRFDEKQKQEKSPGRATITNRSPSQTPRGRGNRQNQGRANRTNVRKALRLVFSSPNEVIAMLKGLKKSFDRRKHMK